MKQMKRFFEAAIILCIAAAFVACNNKTAKSGYVINGEVEGLQDGTVLTLTIMNHDNEPPIAESTIKDGKFHFEGDTEELICANIQVKDCTGKLSVILGDGEFSINAKVNLKGEKAYLWQATFSGSAMNDTLAAYDAHYDSLTIFYEDLQRNHGETLAKVRAMKGSDLQEFKKTEEFQVAASAEKRFYDLVEKTVLDMVLANQNSFWGPLLAMKYYTSFTPDQVELYDIFPDNVKKSYYGKLMKKAMPEPEAPMELSLPAAQQ